MKPSLDPDDGTQSAHAVIRGFLSRTEGIPPSLGVINFPKMGGITPTLAKRIPRSKTVRKRNKKR